MSIHCDMWSIHRSGICDAPNGGLCAYIYVAQVCKCRRDEGGRWNCDANRFNELADLFYCAMCFVQSGGDIFIWWWGWCSCCVRWPPWCRLCWRWYGSSVGMDKMRAQSGLHNCAANRRPFTCGEYGMNGPTGKQFRKYIIIPWSPVLIWTFGSFYGLKDNQLFFFTILLWPRVVFVKSRLLVYSITACAVPNLNKSNMLHYAKTLQKSDLNRQIRIYYLPTNKKRPNELSAK